MPYIPQEKRVEKERKAQGVGRQCETPGELNFAITKVLLGYLEWHGLTYTTINNVMGVLDCVSKEFYRRVAVVYEEKKADENGDVFPFTSEGE